MKKLKVNIRGITHKYPIIIGENLIETIDSLFDFARYSQIAIITGSNIPGLWLKKLREALPSETRVIIVPAGEKEKNINSVIAIWNELQKFRMDRKSLVINLGGGVICDMGGFAASTFLRGIDFLHIPTTVLAQVDASVGGKVGINLNNIKNYIGVFQQPVGVIIDVNTLSTLPKRFFDQGFAELIKHGLIADKAFFELATSKKPQEFNTSELTQMMAKSCEIKARIVEEDQKEHGIRRIVNFGHTIGHAIESLSLETKNPLLHGEAVNIGMISETKISELAGLLSSEESAIIYKSLSRTGLPVSVSGISARDILKDLKLDKKTIRGQINWTLLESIGHAVINRKVDEKIVKLALEQIAK